MHLLARWTLVPTPPRSSRTTSAAWFRWPAAPRPRRSRTRRVSWPRTSAASPQAPTFPSTAASTRSPAASRTYPPATQFAAAKPSPAIAVALELPGLRLPRIVQTVLEGYADRPALGQRAVEFVNANGP